jgi:hypothetical protein
MDVASPPTELCSFPSPALLVGSGTPQVERGIVTYKASF